LSFFQAFFSFAQETIPPPEKTAARQMLCQLLSSSKSIQSVYYEIDKQFGNGDALKNREKIRIWEDPPNWKIVSSIDGTVIAHSDTLYRYDEEQDLYWDLTEAGVINEVTPQFLSDRSKMICQEIMDAEKINYIKTLEHEGNTVTIVEYTLGSPIAGIKKVWIQNAKGVPVKTRIQTDTGTIVEEYHDFRFKDIPGSVFAIPEDKQRQP
jgi:hypothetical protein